MRRVSASAVVPLVLAAALITAATGEARALAPDRWFGQYTLAQWRVGDGVPGARVRAITQTADGYLWLGTFGGVARYDGTRIVTLEAKPPFKRMTDVLGLLAARDGRLWIAPSAGDPVCVRADVLEDCFPTGQRLPRGARIADLRQDDSGVIWLATSDEIYRFAEGRLRLVHAATAQTLGRLNAVLRDKHGRLWVGSNLGLFRQLEGMFVRHPTPEGQQIAPVIAPVIALTETPSGVVWAASQGALVRIEADRTSVHHAPDKLMAGHLTQVLEDRDGNVWIGSRAGLVRFSQGRFARADRRDGLPDDDIMTVFEDREGSLWLGTRGGGIVQITDRALDLQAGPPSVRETFIDTVAEDDSGTLWIGSGRGLTAWREGRERTYTAADGLPSQRVRAVHPGPNNTLWVGTERGLVRRSARGFDSPVAFPGPVTALYLDSSGALWVGGPGTLARVVEDQVTWFALDAAFEGNAVRGLRHDDAGTLWIVVGGRLGTLSADRVVARTAAPGEEPLGSVRAIYSDEARTLWLGTSKGLARHRNGVFRLFSARDGLIPSDIQEVQSDDDGGVWLGTGHGIMRVAKAALDAVERGDSRRIELVSFEISDQGRDVATARANQPASWRARDGALWFASTRGVVRVDPKRMRANPVAPPVVIETAIIDGRRVRPGEDAQDAPAFPPGAGTLEFHFGAVSLLEPQKARHCYRLEGFDANWIDAGTRRAAYYTNIPPGHYRFHVQGSNGDGVWNLTGQAIQFRLSPHFHQRVWFYLLCASVLAGLAFWLHRGRLARVHAQHAATLQERKRVARELHDSFLQGMSGAMMQIRGIRKGLARASEDPTAPPAAAEALKTLEDLLGSSLEETRQFVWDLREPDAVDDLPARLREIAARMTNGQSLAWDLKVEGRPLPLPPEVARAIGRIAQEALANVVKHAHAARVEMRLHFEPNTLTLSVHDDGQGFDPKAVAQSPGDRLGLIGMRERAARVGTLTIDSRPGAGVEVRLQVPLASGAQERSDA